MCERMWGCTSYLYTFKVIQWWGAGRRGMDWEFGVIRCKLLHLEWINNKVLLYSTGNSPQYCVMTCMGKESKKEWIYVYV